MTTLDAVVAGPLSPELARRMNAYWRVANYLAVGQIYLYGNPLLKRPLEFSDVSGLAVGQQLGGRERLQRAAPEPGRPQAGRAASGSPVTPSSAVLSAAEPVTAASSARRSVPQQYGAAATHAMKAAR